MNFHFSSTHWHQKVLKIYICEVSSVFEKGCWGRRRKPAKNSSRTSEASHTTEIQESHKCFAFTLLTAEPLIQYWLRCLHVDVYRWNLNSVQSPYGPYDICSTICVKEICHLPSKTLTVRACMCVHALGSRSGVGRNRPVVRLLLLGLQGPGGWGESIRPRFMPLSMYLYVCAT